MTDLERAYALVHSDPEHIEAALAAARREGAEAERAKHDGASEIIQRAAQLIKTGDSPYFRGAEDMRERAAQCVEDYFNPETCGPCAAAIRALPVTPEER